MKMLNTTNHLGNANQNYNETLFNTHKANYHCKKIIKLGLVAHGDTDLSSQF